MHQESERLPGAPFFLATLWQLLTNSLNQSDGGRRPGAHTRKLLRFLNSRRRGRLCARSRPRGAAWWGTRPAPAASIPLGPGALGGRTFSTICCLIIKGGIYKGKTICCQTNCQGAELLRELGLASPPPHVSLMTRNGACVSFLRKMVRERCPVHPHTSSRAATPWSLLGSTALAFPAATTALWPAPP